MRLILLLLGLGTAVNALEITEIFSFNCGHCYNIEPQVAQVAATPGIKIIPIPLYDQNDINNVAVISSFFAAKSLGKEWEFRRNYFNSVFAVGYAAYSPAALKYTLSKSGLDNSRFYKIASSQNVINQMNNAVTLAVKYNASGTPTFIVNGRFYEGENALQEIFSR